jgi:GntR family transcriptional regulator, transcriptional repressor for pyruvate dehydrogenase complex
MSLQIDGLTKIVRAEPHSNEVLQRLLDYLRSGKITVGSRLPSERELATALGVGRLAVRDVLKPLALLGLLDVRVGDGTYLRNVDSWLMPRVVEWGLLLTPDRMLELAEARRHLEVILAGLAAIRRDEQAIERIREQLQRMARSMAGGGAPQRGERERSRSEAYVDADVAFHLAIAAAAQNSVLCGILESSMPLLRVWIARVIQAAGESQSFVLLHTNILKAIEAGDRAAAEAAMAEHMEVVTAWLTRSLPKAVQAQKVEAARKRIASPFLLTEDR